LIKKQGNRKANIKKTKRIRRGGGGERNRGKRKGGGERDLVFCNRWEGGKKQGRGTNGEKGGEGGGERKRGKRKGRVRGLTQWFWLTRLESGEEMWSVEEL
jgi:hypothetical protein